MEDVPGPLGGNRRKKEMGGIRKSGTIQEMILRFSLLQFRDERKQKGNDKKKTVLQHRGT